MSGILVAILIGFNLASNLSKPITNLINSANKISDGNFDAKVSETDQFDEIKVLKLRIFRYFFLYFDS